MTAVRRFVPFSGASVPLPIDQRRCTERAVAIGRVFTAACALAAIALIPTPSDSYIRLTSSVLVVYVGFASAILVALTLTPAQWPSSALALHVIDVAVAGAVTFSTTGANSPFFLLFLFTLLAGAYRWGFAAALATACAAASIVLVQAAVQGQADGLIIRAAYFLLAGILIGYLARSERQFRAEAVEAAAAVERRRIARELHDGVIQTVAGVAVQIAALKIRLAEESPAIGEELDRMDAVLREEVQRLRDMMQQMRPLELDPDKLVDALEDFVHRFQRETGIAARFVTQLDYVALPPRACREVARILQEALVNVRRHSGAQNVSVRLSALNGDCCLSIDDDGCGFPFRGRLSHADLDAARKGPMVINERVRLLGGALTIDSEPGRGARLEIAVPLTSHAKR